MSDRNSNLTGVEQLSQLMDATNVLLLDLSNRQLSDNIPRPAIDIQNRLLVDATGLAGPAIDWDNRLLIDNTGTMQAMSFTLGGRKLFDDINNQSIDFGRRFLFNSSPTVVVDYGNNLLIDSPGFNSIDWNNRLLADNGGATILNWNGPALAMTQITTSVSNPASGTDFLYFKSDDKLYGKSSGGAEVLIGPSTGGGPLPNNGQGFFIAATMPVGTLAIQTNSTNNAFCYTAFNSTHSNGDTIEVPFYAAAGTYTFTILGQTSNSLGMLDWYIDNVVQTTGQDWYSGSAVFNVMKTFSGTVATDGNHILKGIVNGHNGSSSDFYFLLISFWFQ